MSNLINREGDSLSQWDYLISIINEGIHERNKATSKIVEATSEILKLELWKDHYSTEDEFTRTVLGVEISYCGRLIRANKLYLYLISETEDLEEIQTLSNMKESAYREIRSVLGFQRLLRGKNEREDTFNKRLQLQAEEENQQVAKFWKWAYPKIRDAKALNNIDQLPSGGCNITAKDITEVAVVLKNIVTDVPYITVEGVDVDLVALQENSSNEVVNQAIDLLATEAISESLVEKMKRQRQHLRDKLEKVTYWDVYSGTLSIYNGELVIISSNGNVVKLIDAWGDMVGKETSVSIRRISRV